MMKTRVQDSYTSFGPSERTIKWTGLSLHLTYIYIYLYIGKEEGSEWNTKWIILRTKKVSHFLNADYRL